MKRIILGAALIVLLFIPFAFAAEKQVSLEVGGLTCPSCFYIAGKAMLSVSSVKILQFIEGKNETALYIVSYDDEAATPELIVKAVMGYGYPAKLVATPAS